MDKIDDFKRQFATLISNCELTQSEFEKNMFELTMEIAHHRFLESEIDTTDEGFWSILEDLLSYASRQYK